MSKRILFSAVALGLVASMAMGAGLVMVPPVAGQTDSQVRAITPDGRYAAGISNLGTATKGFLWDSVAAPANSNAAYCGSLMLTATGVAYRTSGGVTEVAVHGIHEPYGSGENTPVIGITTDGGATWIKAWRDGANYKNSTIGAANTLAGPGSTDVLYNAFANGGAYKFSVGKFSGPASPTQALTVGMDNKSTSSGSELTVNGISAGSLAAGSRIYTGVKSNYYMQGLGGGTSGQVNTFAGLDGTNAGEAFCAAGTRTAGMLFGRSPKVGDTNLWPYMVTITAGVTSPAVALPTFGDETGSTALGVPYGATNDGRYVSGMLYRGTEKAVLWDTQANSVLDLTDFATTYGLLGNFTRLSRAYSVGVNGSGQPVLAGVGTYNDGGLLYSRGFILTIPEPATLALLVLGGLPLLRRRR